MRILLTNDDSHRSPLLALIHSILSNYGDVDLVVPMHEQSWSGKSMTRFGTLHAHKIELLGRQAWAVAGTPADCVHLAVTELLPQRPDIVISGINAGLNSGLGFILSSGTVGACFEANILGIPGIAVSQKFDTETHSRYVVDYGILPEIVDRFSKYYEAHLIPIFNSLLKTKWGAVNKLPIVWNVNFPYEVSESAHPALTRMSATRYGSVFKPAEGFEDTEIKAFRLTLNEIHNDISEGTDHEALLRGLPTIAPIDIWSFTNSGYANSDDFHAVLAELRRL